MQKEFWTFTDFDDDEEKQQKKKIIKKKQEKTILEGIKRSFI